jgi:hypothetical protein
MPFAFYAFLCILQNWSKSRIPRQLITSRGKGNEKRDTGDLKITCDIIYERPLIFIQKSNPINIEKN